MAKQQEELLESRWFQPEFKPPEGVEAQKSRHRSVAKGRIAPEVGRLCDSFSRCTVHKATHKSPVPENGAPT